MRPDDIARYLQENPVFFEQYADLLSQIYIPHPHGGRAIPLSERQVLTLRERVRALETRLGELLELGEENDAIGEKMHRLCLALLAAPDLRSLLAALDYNLREDFAVPHVALRVWREAAAGDLAALGGASEDARRHASELTQPYCGPAAHPEVVAWFGEAAAHVRSVASIPLRDKGECFGMLVLGSEDVSRFYPEMGTVYLKRLGELASASLLRFL
ncbi:MAG TPA: DUF484 family protein [Burkholderiales bacterium]|nr:DUF484 family protein [Burkholderiales bacterium]